MKIALFTPVHRDSAIARVSGLIAGSLSVQGHETVIVSTDDFELDAGDMRDDLSGSIHWRQQTAIRDVIWSSDLVVHQVGNQWEFHAGNTFWLPLIGGAVVLHDFFVGDLFLQWAKGRDAESDAILRRLYDIGIGELRSMARSGHFAALAWPAYPLTEWLAELADVVVVHSDFGLPAVERATDAAVTVLPLAGSLEPLEARNSARFSGEGEPGLRILTFGHIIPNKLCEDTIIAISAARGVRARATYRICGAISDAYRSHLEGLASALGVSVDVTGALERHELLAELSEADIIVCVRRPTLESGSASAIESMLSGTPVIVADEGFYASLPSNLVLKVGPENVQADLQRTLRRIVEGGYDLAGLGARAKTYAEATFRADSYATALTALASRAAEHRLIREVDQTYKALRVGPPAVALRYARDSAILRPDPA
jgi:glycosyltransferase involved in cell wall biosynthesis